MNRKIKCPICTSKNFNLILKKDMLDEVYSLVKCKKCSLVFINPLPFQKVLTDYYNDEYDVPIYQQKKVVQKSKKILNILKKRDLKLKSKFFELGSSYGYFLNQVKKYGHVPYGVELSKKACLSAKKNFDISIDNSLFDDSKLSKKEDFFDVAVMFDVLEHLTDPNEVLGGFNKILNKGGTLVLTVPNINSTEFKLYGRFWEWLSPPAHLFYYSPKTLTSILKKNGFEVSYLETYKGDSAGNLIFHGFLAFQQLGFYLLKFILGKKN